MYQSSIALTKPSNSRQPLWRYMTLERLVDLLETGQLFFTHVPAFADGLEGALTTRSREHLFRWFVARGSKPDVAHREVQQYETHHSAFYANCWHMNDFESYLMWKAYADRGYAIRTTFERVQASFESFVGSITGGVVSYVDFERDLTSIGNVFNHVITKDLPYRDEREFRLLFWRHDPKNQPIEPGPIGVRVQVDIRLLVERVFVSPAEHHVPGELLGLLEHHGIACDSSLINLRSLSVAHVKR